MNLKSIIANRELKAKLESVNRKKRVFNLDSASSIGILWEYDQRETFLSLEKELRNMGIETSNLCYFPAKNAVIPRGIIGFTRKQLSWTEIPKSEDANNFLLKKFDILIDLTGQKSFPIVYLTALSSAAFKIGHSSEPVNYLDINIEFEKHPEPKHLAEEVLYFLKRINKTAIE